MMRVEYIKYERKDVIIRKMSEQEKRKILCPECRVERKKEWWNQEEVVHPIEKKAQQGNIQTEALKGIARKRGEQREVRRMFKILKEVQLDIGVEKINMHENITVKALLDSGAIEMFTDQKMVTKHRFRLQKLERSIAVRNIDGIHNSARAITYQVEMNVYYKVYIEKMRMNVCNLGKTDIILEILQLQAHNPEIN